MINIKSYMITQTKPFIVDNAVNTCYISSLLMGLFYNESPIENILFNNAKMGTGIYLQEYIKNNFVDCVRNNKSVLSESIDMIRHLCIINGWNSEYITDLEKHLNQQDVSEFYKFMSDLFNIPQIEIQKKIVNDINLENDSEYGIRDKIPFISLDLSQEIQENHINVMINNWINNKNNNTYMINIVNIPFILTLMINRFKNNMFNNNPVTIPKRIGNLINTMLPSQPIWSFHAAICCKGTTNENIQQTILSVHYYTLIYDNDKYYIFDDKKIPCMNEISMKDKQIIEMIKKECFFLIYKYST